jgi:hypothetical protein
MSSTTHRLAVAEATAEHPVAIASAAICTHKAGPRQIGLCPPVASRRGGADARAASAPSATAHADQEQHHA